MFSFVGCGLVLLLVLVVWDYWCRLPLVLYLLLMLFVVVGVECCWLCLSLLVYCGCLVAPCYYSSLVVSGWLLLVVVRIVCCCLLLLL